MAGSAAVPAVGVLALQGDFAEHERALRAAGLRVCQVRAALDLEGLAGLVLPGGESTAMLRLLELEGLAAPLGSALRSGMPTLATCAGLILLAREVRDPVQRSLGVLDITVQRNAYGRQIHSGTFPLDGLDGPDGLNGLGMPPGTAGVFIRAPRILRCGPAVEVLACRAGEPVLVRQGAVVGTCFHPELQRDHPVTRAFAASVQARWSQERAIAR